MKTIAILGKPNVGKSSLFNRLTKKQDAITSNISGTTRDVKKSTFFISGVELALLDTGGIDKAQGLFQQVSNHSMDAGLNADLVLYVVDGKGGIQDDDIATFRALQKAKKPLILVVNKIDNDKFKLQALDFQSFGTNHISYISILHNRGITKLLDSIFNILDLQMPFSYAIKEKIQDMDESLEEFLDSLESKPVEQEEEAICVGIIGRVNVGKSSLLNALTGKNRSVVSEVAGTTIDPVDEEIEFESKKIRFIDTAGIRRASKILGIEKFALDRTNKALAKSHIAILVLDSSSEFVELDEKISALIPKHNLGVIIALNKWDSRKKEHNALLKELRHKFRFLEYAPVVCVSATSGKNIPKLKNEILSVFDRLTYRIPTSLLNECISQATQKHHLPSDHGKIVKIYYATQFDTTPPKIALVMNRPNALHFSYKRYLINVLREQFDFSGVPIFIESRGKKDREQEV